MSDPINLAPIHRLEGEVRVPGDKSITPPCPHPRCAGARPHLPGGLAPGEDVAHTRVVPGGLRRLFVRIYGDGRAMVEGNGPDHALSAPGHRLDCGNSGSTMRMLAGAIAGHPITVCLQGDASLMRRRMRRIAAPLQEMGAAVRLGPDGTAPMTVEGHRPLRAISFEPPVASAQVKTAVLLCPGLFADGPTTVLEPAPTPRPHRASPRALRHRGREAVRAGSPSSRARLQPFGLRIPGDISSAAFFLCLAAAREGWRVRCPEVGLNPGRDGSSRCCAPWARRSTSWNASRRRPSNPVGDVEVRGGPLRGTRIGGALVPRLIDELPVIAVLATQAEGVTEIRDAAELRTKESDRIAHLAEGLRTDGCGLRDAPDGLVIEGPPRWSRLLWMPPATKPAGDGLRGGRLPCGGPGADPYRRCGVGRHLLPGFFQDLDQLSSA